MLAVVAEEVRRLGGNPELDWDRWEELFDRLTRRVIFGDRYADDRELTELLERLMGQANRLVGTGKHGPLFHELYGRLERTLIEPEPGTLIARISSAPQSEVTRVVHQIPHWMFAMRDTLGANTFRALAAIAALPAVEEQVRAELDGVDLGEAAEVAGLPYLGGCLHEAMRLWPTTPLLAREAVRDTEIAGGEVPEGTQVMIVNTFNHRDTDAIPDADRFVPERWADGERDIRFNHLSNGTQDCPGGALVLLLGKAVLGQALALGRWRLESPQLDPSGPLPNMFDFFRIRLARA
jgi:cytochrome P450